jgi:Bacterial archaeo-eukaryotic release factor family 10
MSINAEVIRFARLHRGVKTLTIYINGEGPSPAQRARWRVPLRTAVDSARAAVAAAPPAERALFEACVERLMDALPKARRMLGAPGWVGLASEHPDVYIESLTAPVATSVDWLCGARLAPYFTVAGDPDALLAVVDREHARVYTLAASGLTPLEAIETRPHGDSATHMGTAPKPGFHTGTRGRTAHDASQRNDREAFQRHVSAVVGRLVALLDEEVPLVLGGASATVAHVAERLPAEFADRVVIAENILPTMEDPALLGPAREAVAGLRGARHQRHALAWTRLAHADHNGTEHAAVGLEAVVHAASLDELDALLVSPALAAARPIEIEELIQRALVSGATVEIADPGAAVVLDTDAGGIAARLRFSVVAEGAARSS